MKKFILGFIVGALLFSIIIPVCASMQQYTLNLSDCKLVIDKTDFDFVDMPMLNYKGYNYIPAAAFRSICDKLKIGFEFDNATKEIRIDTKKEIEPVKEGNAVSGSNDKKPYLAPELDRGHKFYGNVQYAPQRKEDGLVFYELDGIEYISIFEAGFETFNTLWRYNREEDYGMIDIYSLNDELLMGDISFVSCDLAYNNILVEYQYYKDVILPLVSIDTIQTYEFDGKKYVTYRNINNILNCEKYEKYSFAFKDDLIAYFAYFPVDAIPEVILDDIQCKRFEGNKNTFVDYDIWINEIAPVLKGE